MYELKKLVDPILNAKTLYSPLHIHTNFEYIVH